MYFSISFLVNKGKRLFGFTQLVALGCVQGIIVAIYLMFKVGASRILGIYICLLTINMGVSFYIDSGLFETDMYFISLWRVINTYLLIGPLLLAYVLLMLNRERRWQGYDLLHLVPFSLSLLSALISINSQALPFFDFVTMKLENITEQPLNDRFKLGYLLPALHFICYVAMSVWLVLRKWISRKDVFKSSQLYWLIAILAISLFMMLSAALVFMTSIILKLAQSPNTFAIANFTTVIGFFALTFLLLRFGRPKGTDLKRQTKYKDNFNFDIHKAEDKRNPALSVVQQQQLNELEELMHKDKLYLDPNLSQLKIAELLKISRHQLSELLRLHQSGNFYELVNQYRVNAVVEAIKGRPVSDNLINIAYDCGFSSKSSFNQVFKKYKNQTPGQFRKKLYLSKA